MEPLTMQTSPPSPFALVSIISIKCWFETRNEEHFLWNESTEMTNPSTFNKLSSSIQVRKSLFLLSCIRQAFVPHATLTCTHVQIPIHVHSYTHECRLDSNITQADDVKYLLLHLYRRLTWHKDIFTKRKQLGIALTKMLWLLGRKSKLFTNN
jgi:hypothetical protein